MNTLTLNELIDKVLDVEAKAEKYATAIIINGAIDFSTATDFKAGARAVGEPLALALREAAAMLELLGGSPAEAKLEEIRSILEKAVGDA